MTFIASLVARRRRSEAMCVRWATEHDRQRPRDGRGIDSVMRIGHRARVEARPTNLVSTVASSGPSPACPGKLSFSGRCASFLHAV